MFMRHYEKAVRYMKKHRKTILRLVTVICIASICVIVFYSSVSEYIVDSSPNGQFSIVARWIDVGGWGWRGRVYLVKHGLFDAKQWTGFTTPIASKWLSDWEFEIIDDSSWHSEPHVFHVEQFFPP